GPCVKPALESPRYAVRGVMHAIWRGGVCSRMPTLESSIPDNNNKPSLAEPKRDGYDHTDCGSRARKQRRSCKPFNAGIAGEVRISTRGSVGDNPHAITIHSHMTV